MFATRLLVHIAVIGVTLAIGTACGQEYPSKPIRIITAGAGGGSDFDARQIAQGIYPRPVAVSEYAPCGKNRQ